MFYGHQGRKCEQCLAVAEILKGQCISQQPLRLQQKEPLFGVTARHRKSETYLGVTSSKIGIF